MERFAEHLYRRLAEGLLLFERPSLHEIYVLSMYIDFDDGPHRFKVWLYYNTYSHLRESVAQGEDHEEARWNFALWEQDFITAVGLTNAECRELADEECHLLLAEWLDQYGLYRSGAEIEAMLQDADPSPYSAWEAAARGRLLHLLTAVARHLQDSGVVLVKFGRSLPLLVHEWDYDHWALEATRSVNPAGLTVEFEAWLRSEGCCE